jgi:sterol desaturase/sphingolipid hydroxylase (fatty acid hydroxylase superfamily)
MSTRNEHAELMDIPPTHTPLLSYGLYPALVGGAASAAAVAVNQRIDRSMVMPLVLIIAIAVCMLVEWRRPLEPRWSMTSRSLGRRDLPFIGLGLLIERVSEVAVATIARRTVAASGFGPLGRLPLALQVVVAIVLFDLCWYGYHRAAHRLPKLWRVHGAHHSPSQLYVLMHGVFHPFDEVVVRFVLALVVFRFGGFTPDATFVALVIIGTVGIVSHTNADIRLWVLNHVLIGPETHRYHHSADHQGNYGTVTSLWDQLFATFIFHPTPPTRLGLASSADYPDPEQFLRVLAWPLTPAATAPTPLPMDSLS